MILDDRVPDAIRLPFEWLQGQHLTIIGDTGTGKSSAASVLLLRRLMQVVFQTKADDVKYPLHVRTKHADIMRSPKVRRILLAPSRGLNRVENQRNEFIKAAEQIWADNGRWTIYIDELFYACAKLKLTDEIDELLTQGRSLKITVMMGMQRPVDVTRFAMSQSTHLLSFAVEGRDVKTVRDATSAKFAEVVESLAKHEIGWYHRPSRAIWRGFAQDWEVFRE